MNPSKLKKFTKFIIDQKENKPKTVTAYILCQKEERHKIAGKNPNMISTEVFSELGKRWKKVDKATKDNLKAKATEH